MPTTEVQSEMPLARVNHNKFMVTENEVYISNSNWSEDYFTDTTGISIVFGDMANETTQTTRAEVERVFQRDWNSEYSIDVESPVFPDEKFNDTENSAENSSACSFSKHSAGLLTIAMAFSFFRR